MLEKLGLSSGRVALILLGVFLVLALLFAFILLGVIAFTTAGGFSASVNSLLPISAGGWFREGSGCLSLSFEILMLLGVVCRRNFGCLRGPHQREE